MKNTVAMLLELELLLKEYPDAEVYLENGELARLIRLLHPNIKIIYESKNDFKRRLKK